MAEENDLPFPDDDIKDSVTSMLSIFQGNVSKKSIETMVKGVSENIRDTGKSLDSYLKAKAAMEYLTQLQKEIQPDALEQVEMYGKGENTVIYGIKFEKATAATRFDYSHDEVWCEIDDKIKDLTEQRKKREDLMKQAMKFSGVFDEEGIEVKQAVQKSGGGDTIRVTIPAR